MPLCYLTESRKGTLFAGMAYQICKILFFLTYGSKDTELHISVGHTFIEKFYKQQRIQVQDL